MATTLFQQFFGEKKIITKTLTKMCAHLAHIQPSFIFHLECFFGDFFLDAIFLTVFILCKGLFFSLFILGNSTRGGSLGSPIVKTFSLCEVNDLSCGFFVVSFSLLQANGEKKLQRKTTQRHMSSTEMRFSTFQLLFAFTVMLTT